MANSNSKCRNPSVPDPAIKKKLDRFKITNKPIAKGEGAPEVARSEVALSEHSNSEESWSSDPDWPKDANGNPEPYIVLGHFTIQVPRRQ